MFDPAQTARFGRRRRERQEEEARTLGADDPAIAGRRLPDPVVAEFGDVGGDPFAMDSSIELRSERTEGDAEVPDGASVGRMWSNYAKAALGDLAG